MTMRLNLESVLSISRSHIQNIKYVVNLNNKNNLVSQKSTYLLCVKSYKV